MGKYDPLAAFLRRRAGDDIELTFTEIERRLGALLPKAAQADGWWSGDGVQVRAWWGAGFSAELTGPERVRFTRRPVGG
ncbi:MAG: hypothetical protein ACK4SI_12115 [Brevundimonas aurantiaca]|uniref:DUF7662 domain-containing protein n=1 Tax=Brevundimonas aurantiaca TaxID=74316 RepID=UPI00391D701B